MKYCHDFKWRREGIKEVKIEKNIAVFRGKEVLKTIHENEWWFSIIDVVEVLTGNDRPRKYWSDLKKRLISEGYGEVSKKSDS